MANAKGKVTVVAEVPTGLRDEADRRAADEGRSRSELIGRAIRFYCDHAPVVVAEDPLAVPPPVTPAGKRSKDKL